MVLLQGFLTFLLIALLWNLFTKFRRSEFFRLWTGVWIVYGLALAAGQAALELGPGQSLAKQFLVWAFSATGFVQIPLLVLGALAFARDRKVPAKTVGIWLGLALAGGTAVFLASLSVSDGPGPGKLLQRLHLPALPEGSYSQVALLSYAVRSIPRQLSLGLAYLACALIFWPVRRRARLPAVPVLAFACGFYGLFQLLFIRNLTLSLIEPSATGLPVPPYFADLVFQMMLSCGLFLLLLDEYRSTLEQRSETEARFGGVVHSLAEGLLITDPDDIILFANDRIAEMTGYSVAELVGRPSYVLLLPEKSWPIIWKKNKERMAGMEDRYEIALRRKYGATFWVEISASPYRNLAGEVVGTMGAITDITERREMALAVAASEEKFSRAFLSSPDAIAISTLTEGRYLEANESLLKLAGYSRESLIGRTATELGLWVNLAERDQLVQRLRQEKSVRDYPVRLQKRTGEIVEGLLSAELIEIGGQLCILSITRDRTTQNRLQRLQGALFEIAQAADRAPDLGSLFAEVHRVIRQVMAAENLYIALYDEASDTLSFPYFVDQHDVPSPPGPPGRGNTAYVLRTGHSLLSPAHVHEQMKMAGEVETVGVMSEVWLGVPLKVGEKCIGVLAVQHYTDRNAYGEAEQRTLEYVSSQVATVLHRKRTEEALRESEERYRSVAETATDGIITVDQNSRILFANPAASRIFGYPISSLPGMDLALLMPEYLRELHRGAMQRYIDTGKRHITWEGIELTGLHKDGNEIPLEVSFAELRKAGAHFFTGIVRDVTERKQAEKALRDSEEKFSRAFHSSPDAMTISTFEDSRFLEVNQSFLRLTGYARAEVEGHTSLELSLWVHPEKRPEFSSLVRQTGRVEDYEFEMRRKDGTRIVGLLSADVIEFGGGKCFLSVIRDITARKKMEEALRQSEEKFAKAFFASPDALVISSLRTNLLLDVNESFCRLSGYSKEEAVGRSGLELGIWERAQERERVLQMMGRGESPRNMEFTFRARSGRKVTGLFSAEVIEFGGERCMLGVVRDISERKEMDEALRTSEERFRELFENANDVVYTHDLDGNFTSLNRTGERVTGYTRQEAMRMNMKDLLAVDQLDFARRMIHAKIEGQGPTTYELQIRAKDGRPIDLEVSTRIVVFDGKPAGVQGIARDITERRKGEQALRDSEERYRHLFQNNPLPMFVYDVDSLAFLAVNESAIKSYGYSRSEFLGLTLKDLRPEEEIHYLMQRLTTEPMNQHAAVHRKKDGTLIDVEVLAHSVEWFGKRARMVIAEDITERVRAENAIRESEAKFRALAESSPYAILIARDAQVVFANRAAQEITGYSVEELSKLDPVTIISPAFRPLAEEQRARRQKGSRETHRFELKFMTKRGMEKWLDITTNVITYEGLPAILVNAMDVTERKAVEDQLRQSQKMEAVGRLAGGVAHDFNNLLMIMRGYADLILDSQGTDELTRRNAEQITKAAERAAGLTQQLLAFSRKQVLAPQVLDLHHVVLGVDKMLRRLIGEDVELITGAQSDLWPVTADPNQIEQILLNLAINARDAMPKGGKLIIDMQNVELDTFFVRQHAGSASGPHVLISVTDTGMGMAPEVRARVFEPFFTTKEVGRGTGLGLATVYGIVKQSNGYILVYSETGKGTTFKVYLPRAAGAAVVSEPLDPVTHQGGNETILLVEDESDVRELARQFLDSRGYRVLEAQDGNEALTISSKHAGPIDLLVTDVVMPGMSGRELADQLIPRRPQMRVLYVSGYTAEAIGRHGILDPGTEFLQKPFSRETLARKLREVLDKPS